jgi:hypothetical protein
VHALQSGSTSTAVTHAHLAVLLSWLPAASQRLLICCSRSAAVGITQATLPLELFLISACSSFCTGTKIIH